MNLIVSPLQVSQLCAIAVGSMKALSVAVNGTTVCEQQRFQNNRDLNYKFISLAYQRVLISSPRMVWWTWLHVVL